MSEQPSTPASSRSYAVVWAGVNAQDTFEPPVHEAIADDVHRILGETVRIMWTEGGETLKDESLARDIAIRLERIKKIVIEDTADAFSASSHYCWEIVVPPGDFDVLNTHKQVIAVAFDLAVERLFPEWLPFRPIDIHEMQFSVRKQPVDVPLDWHIQLRQRLHAEGGNQAVRLRTEQARVPSNEQTPAQLPSEDGLVFTNEWELKVYQALKRWQDDKPDLETIGIFPQPGVRVKGRTFFPDFLVTYKGRAGIIEVDSKYHKGRRDHDKSRESLLEDAGVSIVERVGVEDVDNADELEATIRRFLHRLTKS
ncbi:hypothetical protein GCM10023194_58660 [Planotetraspora phitsanulokensis]|uniref:DUF559 domain-containing protein n=1 Tax=Planotetraspora phitsanulokensis TaxID=575192 RepID=A0A8J3XG23_9ACTN|nr:hypothetical protein [Planotetraspora phitsanulokensis]GII40327.1 hypothetical protein Pph01_53300 [Planotetraspora phitsanulokensis]